MFRFATLLAAALPAMMMFTSSSAAQDQPPATAQPTAAQPAAAKPSVVDPARVRLADLAWLAGSWRFQDGVDVWDEVWAPARGGVMPGVTTRTAAGSLNLYELMSLEESETGPRLLIRHFGPGLKPWGNEAEAPSAFSLTDHVPSRAVFTNPDNDFPRTITYTRSGDRLTCRLEGEQGGAARCWDLAFELVVRAAEPAAAVTVSAEEARAAFDRLCALQGTWKGRSTKGWTEESTYRLIAGGSVLMHTAFDAHPGETMATMFHLDSDRLMMTHYCVARNQPRLVCSSIEDGGRTLRFTYLDGTNMPSRARGHMDTCVIRFAGEPGRFTEHWTWYQNGKENWMEEIEMVRVGGGGAAPASDGPAPGSMPAHDHR